MDKLQDIYSEPVLWSYRKSNRFTLKLAPKVVYIYLPFAFSKIRLKKLFKGYKSLLFKVQTRLGTLFMSLSDIIGAWVANCTLESNGYFFTLPAVNALTKDRMEGEHKLLQRLVLKGTYCIGNAEDNFTHLVLWICYPGIYITLTCNPTSVQNHTYGLIWVTVFCFPWVQFRKQIPEKCAKHALFHYCIYS